MAFDYQLEDTVFLPFTTRVFATGIPTVLAGTPAIDIYEDATVTPIITGETLVVSLNSVVGFNMITVTATAASGFNVGGHYTAIIQAGTVGGVSVVGEVVAEFTIDASAAAVDLANGTDGLSALKAIMDTSGVVLTSLGLDAIVSTATGMVEIAKAVWDRILTGATHNISTSAGRRLRAIQDFGQYLGAVHIDTVNGTAGTVVDENGTADNPVDTLADAITLNTTLGFNVFVLSPTSNITLAQTFNNFLFDGKNGWTVVLGGQDVGGTHFQGASVSGIGTGSTEITFERCNIGTVTLHPFHAEDCGLSGTITFGLAGDYLLGVCHSRVAGPTTPIIDTGAALLNVNLAMPDYNNGIEIRNLNAAGIDEFSISGIGQIIYAASSSGTVNQRGDWKVTNTGGVTITEDDNTANVAATKAKTDNLTFTSGSDLDANIQKVNDVVVTGTGALGDEWGP